MRIRKGIYTNKSSDWSLAWTGAKCTVDLDRSTINHPFISDSYYVIEYGGKVSGKPQYWTWEPEVPEENEFGIVSP